MSALLSQLFSEHLYALIDAPSPTRILVMEVDCVAEGAMIRSNNISVTLGPPAHL